MMEEYIDILKNNYQMDANEKKLREHFERFVRCPNGQPFTDADSQTMTTVAHCLFGYDNCNNIKMTGSIAQNLKCESPNKKGDVDVMLLSDFPTINKEEQRKLLVPANEIGYYKIKHEKVRDKYPDIEKEGIKYINAASLRRLDLLWWPQQLRFPVFLFDLFAQRTHVFNKFEQPDNGAATSIFWRSSFSTLGTFDGPGVRYYKIIIDSYKANIFPILESNMRIVIEEFFQMFTKVLLVSVHFIDSEWQLLSKDVESNVQISNYLKHGVSILIMKYFTSGLKTKNFTLKKAELRSLATLCDILQRHAEKTTSNLYNEDEIRSRKEGFLDIIPAINCKGFPDIASNWRERVLPKDWPDNQVVNRILQAGFQLVPKAKGSNGDEDKILFRLSFNDAETLLALSISQTQSECFRIFKMFYYEKLQTEPKIIETYHLKTIFFWFLEDTADKLWKRENRVACCLMLLHRLATALKEHHLSHYFIPEMNLFRHLHSQSLQTLASKVCNIIKDPIAQTGNIMEAIMEFYTRKASKESTFYDKFETKDIATESEKFFNDVMQEIGKEKYEIDKECLQYSKMFESCEEMQTGTLVTGHKMINNDGQQCKISSLSQLHPIARFYSDMIFARQIELQTKCTNSSWQNGNEFRASGMLLLFLSFLPVVNITLKDCTGFLGTSTLKNFKRYNQFKLILRIFNFVSKIGLLEMMIELAIKLSRLRNNAIVDSLTHFINPIGVKQHKGLSRGPSSDLFLVLIVFVVMTIILAICSFPILYMMAVKLFNSWMY